MSLILKDIILEKWEYKSKDFEYISQSIQKEAREIVGHISTYKKEWAKGEGREIPNNFDDDVNDRIHGLLIGFAKRIMYKFERPKRALSEITITNIKNYHEGRIDAILEFENGQYGAIDWKAYNLDPVNGSGSEKWQLVANLMLLNYRYTGFEDNWSKCLFGSIVYYSNAYIPRFPIKEDTINKVKEGRNFSHEILCGRSPPAKKPQFCPVCDTGSSLPACTDCQFYRQDSKLANSGKIPPNYEQIRKTLFRKRYMVLEERAETHRQKFVIGIMLDKMGELAAIAELEKAGIVHTGYRLEMTEKTAAAKAKAETNINSNNSIHQNQTCITLIRDDFRVFLQPRKQVRLIVKEKGIPLLACTSTSGGIKEIDGKRLTVDFRTRTLAKRAINILSNDNASKNNGNKIDKDGKNNSKDNTDYLENEIIIIPDEINLTKRLLEPLHKFHKLAADILVPVEFFGASDNAGKSEGEEKDREEKNKGEGGNGT